MADTNLDNERQPVSKGALLFFIIAVLIIGYISVKLVAPTLLTFRQNKVRVGRMAPDVAFPDLSDQERALSEYRGKVVLLNIWASWCRPCVAEMPSMERLYKALQKEAFEIVAVSVDAEGKTVVKPFVDKHRLSFPVLLDKAGSIRTLYGTTGVPESFIIDPEGKITRKIVGPIEWDTPQMMNYLRSLKSSG